MENDEKQERYQAYSRGWKHGAGGNAMAVEFITSKKNHIRDEYHLGYTDGYRERSKAITEMAKRLDYKPSILRVT